MRNFSAIGGKTCLCAEVRSWKDGNTGVGTSECGGNQFVPVNGGKKKIVYLPHFPCRSAQKHHYTRTSNANRFKIFHQVDLPDYLMFAQDDHAEKCTRMPEARAELL